MHKGRRSSPKPWEGAPRAAATNGVSREAEQQELRSRLFTAGSASARVVWQSVSEPPQPQPGPGVHPSIPAGGRERPPLGGTGVYARTGVQGQDRVSSGNVALALAPPEPGFREGTQVVGRGGL